MWLLMTTSAWAQFAPGTTIKVRGTGLDAATFTNVAMAAETDGSFGTNALNGGGMYPSIVTSNAVQASIYLLAKENTFTSMGSEHLVQEQRHR